MLVLLNRDHINLWLRFLVGFAFYFASCVIFGAALHPRWDELLFVGTLPLWIIVPYAVFCFVAVLVKAWWLGPIRGQHRLRLIGRLVRGDRSRNWPA